MRTSNTDEPVGVTSIGQKNFITTGVLGVTYDDKGDPVRRRLPELDHAAGRPRTWARAQLAFRRSPGYSCSTAPPICCSAWRAAISAATSCRPGASFARDISSRDIWNHVRLRRPRGDAARRYNVLQKLAYLGVIFGLLPLMVLTGLTMSPAVTAALPFLFDMFGGRQSARTIHFVVANLLVLFVLVHVIQVILAGPVNEMRSMITGRFAIRPEAGK